MRFMAASLVVVQLVVSSLSAQDVKTTETYAHIKAEIDSVRAINTHDHLRPFEQIGRQIMRDNALELFPQLRGRLWRE